MSTGLIALSSADSVAFAARWDERTAAKVAPARTSVPNAVPRDAPVLAQSVIGRLLRRHGEGVPDSGSYAAAESASKNASAP